MTTVLNSHLIVEPEHFGKCESHKQQIQNLLRVILHISNYKSICIYTIQKKNVEISLPRKIIIQIPH